MGFCDLIAYEKYIYIYTTRKL